MPNAHLRRSPLAQLGLGALAVQARDAEHGVALRSIAFQTAINLRGPAGDERFALVLQEVIGATPPPACRVRPGKGDLRLIWLGPDEWLAVAPPDQAHLAGLLSKSMAVAGQHVAVNDVSDNYTTIEVSGPQSVELLSKGCPLDLHPLACPNGGCAQSLVAKAEVILVRDDTLSELRFHLMLRPSFAEYLWAWLSDAAREYGLSVLTSA